MPTKASYFTLVLVLAVQKHAHSKRGCRASHRASKWRVIRHDVTVQDRTTAGRLAGKTPTFITRKNLSTSRRRGRSIDHITIGIKL
jgi:hypothetical protein